MADDNRLFKRIEKPLIIQFRLADIPKEKWEMSVIKNISAGGAKFSSSNELKLNDKIIEIRIKIPEIAPRLLEISAIVVNVTPRPNTRFFDIGVKFLNLSEKNKKDLQLVESIVAQQESKKKK